MKNFLLGLLALTLVLTLPSSTLAQGTLGSTSHEGWGGVSGTVYDGTDVGYDENDSYVNVSLQDGKVISQNAPYSLHGYVDSRAGDGALATNDSMDEIYFQTDNHNPATLAFNFNLELDFSFVDVNPTEPLGDDIYFKIALWGDHMPLDQMDFYIKSAEVGDGTYTYYAEMYHSSDTTPDMTWEDISGLNFNESIQLSTNGRQGSTLSEEDVFNGLVGDGTYLPITLDIYANTGNSDNVIIDWMNSFEINKENPVDVYQEGRLLLADEYSLTSSQNFGATVPEPSTLLLFGIGLTGAFIRKKK